MMKLKIDEALYRLLPARLHEWGHTNRARVRAIALAVALVFATLLGDINALIVLADTIGAGEFITPIVAAVLALVTGEATHKVVSPYDEEADG